MIALVILVGAIAAAGFQLTTSQRFRKGVYDRAAVVGLADSTSVQATYLFRVALKEAIEAEGDTVRNALAAALLVKLAGAPPIEGVSLLSGSIPLPPGQLDGAAAYRSTVTRCGGKGGRRASPDLSQSTAYLCFVVKPSKGAPGSRWAGIDATYPLVSEMAIQPFDAANDANLRFDDLRGSVTAQLRTVYTAVWVTEKSADGPARVRTFAKEHVAPLL